LVKVSCTSHKLFGVGLMDFFKDAWSRCWGSLMITNEESGQSEGSKHNKNFWKSMIFLFYFILLIEYHRITLTLLTMNFKSFCKYLLLSLFISFWRKRWATG
jgi:uncharacterized membrane protein